jgi:hypothetical protein
VIARVLGLLVRSKPAERHPTAAERRASVEACRAKAAQLPPERQSLIAQGELCDARARKLEGEIVRLRTSASMLVGCVRIYLAVGEEADAEQYLELLQALRIASDNLAATLAPSERPEPGTILDDDQLERLAGDAS